MEGPMALTNQVSSKVTVAPINLSSFSSKVKLKQIICVNFNKIIYISFFLGKIQFNYKYNMLSGFAATHITNFKVTHQNIIFDVAILFFGQEQLYLYTYVCVCVCVNFFVCFALLMFQRFTPSLLCAFFLHRG